ncbi:MAG TPA: NAD-dependent epimerase/dehydratase family protein [Longimicrobium sp.]|nr:NAD-dependent epimerase/dehydratase family protein [Longimicrobium sp.]
MTQPPPPPLPSFWHARRVLVTGHTGWMGSWLCAWLRSLGARVYGYALPAGYPSLCRAAGVERAMVAVHGDLRDAAALEGVVRAAAPEVVFHLAARPTRGGHPQPGDAGGAAATAGLLHAIRLSPSARAVVVVARGRGDPGGESGDGWREGHAPGAGHAAAGPAGPGSRTAGFPGGDGPAIVTAWAGSVIGGGDWAPGRLVPGLVRAFVAGVPAEIHAPESVRAWQHVLDPLHGCLCLAMRLWDDPRGAEGAWELCHPHGHRATVLELARRFASAWGGLAMLRVDPPSGAPREAVVPPLDAAGAGERLGWAPLLPLDEAVRWTADWYRAWSRDPASCAQATAAQLQDFTARIDALGRMPLAPAATPPAEKGEPA